MNVQFPMAVNFTNFVEPGPSPHLEMCQFPTALKFPLYDPNGNALNTCFVASVILIAHVLPGLFALYQIGSLLLSNSYGPYRIKYSFGSPWNTRSVSIFHFLRLNAAVLQAVLFAALVFFTSRGTSGVILTSAMALFATTVFGIIPLQYLETTRSPVGHASVIIYWLATLVLFVVVLVLDSLSEHKVYVPDHDKSIAATAFSIEIAVVINSFFAYILEAYFYRPSVELLEYFELNGWDITTVRNLVSTLTFNWLQPTLDQVYETDNIEVSEVPNTIIELKSEVVIEKFSKGWKKELERAKWWRDRRVRRAKNPTEADYELRPSIFFVLVGAYYKTILQGIFFELMDMACLTIAPFLLQKFILYFTEISSSDSSSSSPPLIKGFAFAFGIYLTSVIRYFSFNQYFITFFLCSFSINSSLTALVYEKAMKLSPEARKEKSSGDIVNHVSVDVKDVSTSIENSSDAITIPLRLFLCLGALYKLLGNAMWAGLATALVLVPISSVVSTSIYSLYNVQMEYKDERTRLTSEILNAIKSVKLYSWEKPMLKKLDEVRNKKELVNARKMGLYNAASSFLWGCIPFFISCAVYTVYAIVNKKALVPSVIFPALSLFDLLAQPILMLPNIFSSIAEAKVALNRLGKFFVLDEMELDIVKRTNTPLKRGDVSVKVTDASFVWTTKSVHAPVSEEPEETRYALKNINFTARKGELTCIVGRVGAGKTTLLKSIIGEIPIVKDGKQSVSVNGTVAYCAQSPWILNSSIRENILFGKRYNKQFYNETIEACQLLSDFEVLPNGDATLVGEKGISLSGGQKARVSLARAIYSRADVYLLDDVLSAVDAHVGKKITNSVLAPGGLLASKTLILATNSVKILKIAQQTVFLKDQLIIERGTFEELMASKGEVSKLITEFAKEDEENEDIDEDLQLAKSSSSSDDDKPKAYEPEPLLIQEVEDLGDLQLARVETHLTVGQASIVSYDHVYEFDEDDKHKKQEEEKENKTKGRVKLSVYLEFFKACNWIYVVIWCSIYWCVIGCNILGNYLLKYWSEKNLSSGYNVHPGFYLAIYASTGVFSGFLTFFGAYIIWTYSAVSSSKYFHDNMANSVLRAPMSFFDTTPIGRILNRFSDDISTLDQQVLWILMMFFETSLETLTRLVIVIYNLPFMVVIIAVLVLFYNYFRNRFIPASRELKRLKSALRSPVFSHLQESVNGVETLRAYGESDRFIHSNRRKVDNVTKVDWATQCANRWLSMRLQSIAAIVVLSSTLLILLSVKFNKGLNPALVGFLMTNVFTSTSSLNAIIRLWAETETKSVTIERLIEYGNLKSEAPTIIEGHRPAKAWPATGTINFKNYTTRYREGLDPVLKNINLDIQPAEKIGIVGRTGAGKSSLTLALFRIIEATEGHINIDDLDTSSIGLFDLRSQLNIIPQDAAAFEGTVRENLDPFGHYSDEELWKVLELAHLKEHVEQMKTEPKKQDDKKKKKGDEPAKPQVGLNARVLEGGSNLSSGQKQLLCLARALLKTSKVLVLDEATAAVDVQTDKIIQETIRSNFKDKTILTIAHRLDTIMDSDRVLVLERGQVKEFDSPEELLKNTDGIFYSLCKEGGYLKEEN